MRRKKLGNASATRYCMVPGGMHTSCAREVHLSERHRWHRPRSQCRRQILMLQRSHHPQRALLLVKQWTIGTALDSVLLCRSVVLACRRRRAHLAPSSFRKSRRCTRLRCNRTRPRSRWRLHRCPWHWPPDRPSPLPSRACRCWGTARGPTQSPNTTRCQTVDLSMHRSTPSVNNAAGV